MVEQITNLLPVPTRLIATAVLGILLGGCQAIPHSQHGLVHQTPSNQTNSNRTNDDVAPTGFYSAHSPQAGPARDPLAGVPAPVVRASSMPMESGNPRQPERSPQNFAAQPPHDIALVGYETSGRGGAPAIGSFIGIHRRGGDGANCACCNDSPSTLPLSAFYGTTHRAPIDAANEFLCNGGDGETQVIVKDDWSVHGLHPGDTVVHYDTLDGRIDVSSSNDLCIYAPRFAAVRRVSSVLQHEQRLRDVSVSQPVGLVEGGETQIASTVLQPIEAQRNLRVMGSQRIQSKSRPSKLINGQQLSETYGALLPFEDLKIVRLGQFDNSEKARLASSIEAAIAWSHDKSVQITIDNDVALEATTDRAANSVHRFELPEGKPRLQVVKLASQRSAQPGDIIDFTLRFDNVGDEKIGNVTVVDHLVTRLEYVEDSQECTVAAEFFTQSNQSESLTLRWEIAEPLNVGDGGVIRFKCRVR